MQTRNRGKLHLIPQDVHLACSSGWKHQEVDFELILKKLRVVYQEEIVGNLVLMKGCAGKGVLTQRSIKGIGSLFGKW